MEFRRALIRGGVNDNRWIQRRAPVGGDLEYIDAMTLAKALEGQREI